MNVQITEQKNNILLSRKEISAVLTYDKTTPSKEELKKQLAGAMKLDANLMVVKHIYPGFGRNRAAITVYQYENAEAMKKYEPKKKERKGKKAAEEKKEAD